MLETTCLIFESMEGLDRYATCLQPNKLSTLGVKVWPRKYLYVFSFSLSLSVFEQVNKCQHIDHNKKTLSTCFHGQDYAVLGHSGESAQIPFVEFGKPPANRSKLICWRDKLSSV